MHTHEHSCTHALVCTWGRNVIERKDSFKITLCYEPTCLWASLVKTRVNQPGCALNSSDLKETHTAEHCKHILTIADMIILSIANILIEMEVLAQFLHFQAQLACLPFGSHLRQSSRGHQICFSLWLCLQTCCLKKKQAYRGRRTQLEYFNCQGSH